ncbi:MAG: zinc ribbon domain-containing protein [Clostridiales bacterium]|nr:zinc ribbon domain-containing protein [Clostridiales bacterium]
MAIIVCKNCGKNISDSCEKCIHCGADIKVNDLSTANQDKPLTKAIQKTYENLPEYAQLELENEFIEKNEDMMKYKRKIKGAETFFSNSKLLLIINLFILLISRLIFNLYPKVGVFIENKTIYSLFAIWVIFSILIGLLLLLIGGIMKLIMKNKIKSFTYIKKLKLWLEKEKEIIYNPIFQLEEDQELFNQLNI